MGKADWRLLIARPLANVCAMREGSARRARRGDSDVMGTAGSNDTAEVRNGRNGDLRRRARERKWGKWWTTIR